MKSLTLLLALFGIVALLYGIAWLCAGLACCALISWQDDCAAIEAEVDQIEAELCETTEYRPRGRVI